ncbi:MAG: alpha/beta hydrolase [Luminiphilus sp.]|nr:alpha/beta hydrolase [Luminiphilus sp.]
MRSLTPELTRPQAMNRDIQHQSRFTALLFLNAVVLLGGMASSSALPSDMDPSIPSDNVAVTMPVSFDDLTALPSGGTAPQSFAYGQAAQQSLLRFPPPTIPRGTLLIIHGGCWSNAYDRQHLIPMARALALAGYNVWLAEYRRVGDAGGGWPGTLDDIALAIQRVAVLGGEAPWLVGHSAGGHLALWAAADPALPLKGVVTLAAITNLAQYAQQEGSCPSMVAKFLGGSPESLPDRYAQVTVHDKVFLKPIHLILGEADPIVSQGQLAGFTETNTQIIAESGHFDLVYPGTPAFDQVIETLRNLIQIGSYGDD